MAVQVQDVVFKFEHSCNCCWKKPLEDEDAVFVTQGGRVRRFDFKKAPSADVNARVTIANLERRLQQVAQDQQKTIAILAAIIEHMNLNLREDTRLIRATEVRRIEELALPILRAPSPEPIVRSPSALVRSPKSRDLRLDQLDHSQAEYEVSD